MTQTIRVSTTSDIWVSEMVTIPVTVTSIVPQYSYVPVDAVTETATMTVTATPVSTIFF